MFLCTRILSRPYDNPKYWGVKSEEESLGKLRQIELSMKRAQEYAVNQYNNTVKYIQSIAPNKTVHIGKLDGQQ